MSNGNLAKFTLGIKSLGEEDLQDENDKLKLELQNLRKRYEFLHDSLVTASRLPDGATFILDYDRDKFYFKKVSEEFYKGTRLKSFEKERKVYHLENEEVNKKMQESFTSQGEPDVKPESKGEVPSKDKRVVNTFEIDKAMIDIRASCNFSSTEDKATKTYLINIIGEMINSKPGSMFTVTVDNKTGYLMSMDYDTAHGVLRHILSNDYDIDFDKEVEKHELKVNGGQTG